MSLFEWFKRAVQEESAVGAPQFIPDKESKVKAFVPEETYLQIRLAKMYLQHSRVGYIEKYPMVHGAFQFSGPDGTVELDRIVTPSVPGQEAAINWDRVITINQQLIGPVVYRGGDIELMIGLYAVPEGDWAARFIDLAQGMSELTLQGPLTVALEVVKPMKIALEKAFGANQTMLKLGLNTVLNGRSWLAPGHLAIIAGKGADDLAGLTVENHLLYRNGQLYKEADYMLLAIEATESRGDWQQLGLSKLWNKLLAQAAEQPDTEQLKLTFTQFSSAVITNDDLTWLDKSALIASAKKRIRMILQLNRSEPMRGEADEALMSIDPTELQRRVQSRKDMNVHEMMATDWIEN